MKLKNTTDFADHLLRRMVSWCCRQVGYKPSRIRAAQFRNKSGAYSGHAYHSRRIVASIGPDKLFPLPPDSRPGMDNESFADRTEALVAITAHEIAHLLQYETGRITRLKANGLTERDARRQEVACLRAFRNSRELLLTDWSHEPAEKAKPVASVQDRRAAKAQAALDRWQRKAKLAATKVRQYRRQVGYYERALAAKRGAK